jgi:hypothetical protein
MAVHMEFHLYPQSTDTSYWRMDTIRIPRAWILTKFYTDFYSHYCCLSLLQLLHQTLISEIILLHKLLSKTSPLPTIPLLSKISTIMMWTHTVLKAKQCNILVYDYNTSWQLLLKLLKEESYQPSPWPPKYKHTEHYCILQTSLWFIQLLSQSWQIPE